ncbi:diguanylate cyclase [Sulfurovum sp.]|uniref:diguanylate cyclase n=1 Tax=Sulfurovum sp. TaxID=1969726 RepID=UPI0025D28ABB|nr:diguanylate cyclase [Sulfurovum sp.]
MYFPFISEIVTTAVSTVPETATLSQAIELMLKSEHRHIVVTGNKGFYVLDIYDILRINREHTDTNLRLDTLHLTRLPTIHKEMNILETLDYLQNDVELIAVVNKDETLYGVIAHSDILSSIDPDTLMDNYRLSDLLKRKKRNRWVDKEVITYDIFHTIEKYTHDAAIVVENGKALGIITTKDILKLLKEKKDLSLPVKTYMVTPVMTILQTCTLNEALRLMQDQHFKRIVTVDDEGYLIGFITQKELISIAYSRWTKMMHGYYKELEQKNAKLEQKSKKYEKIAATDALTGLYNRMKFMDLFLLEYSIMVQRHNALSLLVLDLDYFKKINDSYGHNTGDEVLKQISNLLLRELRNVDILCRWGGEEFVALLPSTDAGFAYEVAEKIRLSIENLVFSGLPAVTASIGVTQIDERDELHDAIERADKALYMAKVAGRNCVEKVMIETP